MYEQSTETISLDMSLFQVMEMSCNVNLIYMISLELCTQSFQLADMKSVTDPLKSKWTKDVYSSIFLAHGSCR